MQNKGPNMRSLKKPDIKNIWLAACALLAG
jgi:hypothetical protein